MRQDGEVPQRTRIGRSARRALLAVPAAGACFALAACGGESPSGGGGADSTVAATERTASQRDAPAAGTRTERPGPRGETVKVGDSSYGRILVDGSGLTLYLFDRERRAGSRCYGACADAWPPLLTKGEPRAAGDTDHSLLGTTRRSDGSLQVTYRGHPLYHYHAETEAGQVLCQNVEEFGGLWLVVDPGGVAIRS